jgi:hypothetical protein
MAATLNGVRVLSVKLFTMWRGAWVAEMQLDPDLPIPLLGRATLQFGTATLLGTIDPKGSGTFLKNTVVRLVGGGGGWDTVVPKQDFYSPSGVSSAAVFPATGLLVGEVVTVQAPTILGIKHYERSTGPASRVFAGLDWWVGFDGVTVVGTRLPAVQDPTLVIVDFDPLEQKVTFNSPNPLLPGTVLVDPRFNGAVPIVRDVEQTLDKNGAHGFAWCSATGVSRLSSALQNFVLETAGRQFLRAYRYRFVAPQGSDLALQAVNPVAGVPDLIPVTPWSGLAGCFNKLTLSQEVFVAWDFTTPGAPQPIVVGYSLQGLPQETTIDAITGVHLGPTAGAIDLGGGHVPVALATPLVTLLGALQTWSAAVAAALSTLGGAITAPQATLVTAITAAKTATPATRVTAQ